MVQKTPSVKLSDYYHRDREINSVIRTLIALHGYKFLFKETVAWVNAGNADNWSFNKIWMLYRCAHWNSYMENFDD